MTTNNQDGLTVTLSPSLTQVMNQISQGECFASAQQLVTSLLHEEAARLGYDDLLEGEITQHAQSVDDARARKSEGRIDPKHEARAAAVRDEVSRAQRRYQQGKVNQIINDLVTAGLITNPSAVKYFLEDHLISQ